MSTGSNGGPHELGQNFLVNRSVITTIEKLVTHTTGPIVEIGAGDGALTLPLSRSHRPVTAVEIDSRAARRLTRRAPDNVTVVNTDFLTFRLPNRPHVLVGNLPFPVTTTILRRILAAPHWHSAVLMAQWEVARRRAAVGGASMLTAQSWPWFEFRLHSRVPAGSFRPVPTVDGGLFTVTRRAQPLVTNRREYQWFVANVFTGPGRGLADILTRTGRIDRGGVKSWFRANAVSPHALPKDLTAHQWASLWEHVAGAGTPGARVRPNAQARAAKPPRRS